MLVPGGHTLGVKIFSDGVLIIGLSSVSTTEGEICPAQEGGLHAGDMITHINARVVNTTQSLQQALSESGGQPVAVRVRRGENQTLTFTVTPGQSLPDHEYKLGAWVRDSMAGIGTLTYLNPETGRFGALGHGVNDVDTGRLLPLSTGSVMYSTVEDVRRGEAGSPGELKGRFDLEKDSGILEHNSESGVFGHLDDERLTNGTAPVPVREAPDVKVGKAVIRSNISGDEVREYNVEIVRIYSSAGGQMRDFMLRVTDPALLEATGGIVQGMSGSPVLQDGCLVGAVTHVLINDPKRGYGIFIQSMLKEDAAYLDNAA